MKVGYARVSTPAQEESLKAQADTLTAEGCQKIYSDIASGAKALRPGLTSVLDFLRPGDTLAVTRLDRLGRSAADTLATIKELSEREINVLALDVGLDSSTPGGRMFLNIAGVLADWERDLLVERTRVGLAHARAQGRVGGRPKKLSEDAEQAALAALEAGMSVKQVAQLHGVSRWTIQRLRK
ncbi:recombinase family protein [Rothia nasimurium]|uniref:Recombinase family protein n=1 Tax=Rothia nasimurium TaxID=85336 RepID=A0A4Y9F0C7_9MICC|nr:recombinase family protein [Rothia nasimurium]MBF0809330.1 recombinase family protein [Rothia nasimurium]TFU19883.1 recombinase family protein [Rothia nasimurium]